MSSNIRLNRICQHCGNEFVAKTTVTKFCGDPCAKKAYKERKKKERIRESDLETLALKSEPVKDIQIRDFLSVEETAILLHVSKRTIYRLIRNGIIPATNLGDRLIRIKRNNIDLTLFTV